MSRGPVLPQCLRRFHHPDRKALPGRHVMSGILLVVPTSVRFRRAMMLLASAGCTVPVIARLDWADEVTVRDVIHKFNEIGLACLDPQCAGGRPRLLSSDDEDFVIQTATTRPTVLGKPFTRWSIRKLVDHLRRNIARPVRISREALRCLLARRRITFQRTKTRKEPPDPAFNAKLERIEYALNEVPDRTFAFDEFGSLASAPPPAPAGPSTTAPTGCRLPTAAPTAPTSMAAARASTTLGPHCDRSAPPARTVPTST